MLLGGCVGLSFASEYPGFVEKLCVISCTGNTDCRDDISQHRPSDGQCYFVKVSPLQAVSLFDTSKGKPCSETPTTGTSREINLCQQSLHISKHSNNRDGHYREKGVHPSDGMAVARQLGVSKLA